MRRVGVYIVTSIEAKVTPNTVVFHMVSTLFQITGVILDSSKCKHCFCHNQNAIIKNL